MSDFHDLRVRAELLFHGLMSALLLLAVILQSFVVILLYDLAHDLKGERESWQRHVGMEIERERQHARQLEAIRRQRLEEASRLP